MPSSRLVTLLSRALKVAAAGFPLVLHAQCLTLSTLSPGDTIKVWAVGPRLNGSRGTFSSFAADTLRIGTMEPIPGEALVAVPYAALRRIDVSRGRARSGGRMLVGGILGVAAGAVLGLAIGPTIECSGECGDDGEGIAGAILGIGAGGLVGGVSGTLIGARKRTRWISLSLAR